MVPIAEAIHKDSIREAVATTRRYDVTVPEVWLRHVEVEAKDYADAIHKVHEAVSSGKIELSTIDKLTFSHEMDRHSYDASLIE
jgi:hypothetical protein